MSDKMSDIVTSIAVAIIVIPAMAIIAGLLVGVTIHVWEWAL